MTDLAWTGETTKEKFIQYASAFQGVINTALFNNIFYDIGPNEGIDMGISGNINLNELPSFSYNRVALSETFFSIKTDIAFLLIFIIISFMLAYVSFLRYDIR